MSTATITRRIVSLPADAKWPEPNRPANTRPCNTRPANWWDTGDPGNAKAKALCGTCPFQTSCAPKPGEDVAGQVRAGVAYDDSSRPVIPCRTCGAPIIRQPGQPVCVNGHGSIAEHHNTIAKLRAEGLSFSAIAERIGEVTASGVNRYWVQYLARTGQRPTRVRQQPGVTPEARNRPDDFHEVIVEMLSNLDAQYTYQEVAYAIGSTTDAVKSYWRRHQARAAKAGLPVVNRRKVCNRGLRRHRLERVT